MDKSFEDVLASLLDAQVRSEETLSAAPPALTTTAINAALLYSTFFLGANQFTYSIPQGSTFWPSYEAGSEIAAPNQWYVLNAAQMVRFRAAVNEWDKLIAPNFVETDDDTATGVMRVAFTNDPDISAFWGYASTPPTNGGAATPRHSDIWINSKNTSTTLAAGGFDFEALLHEIGHAMGLKHPFEGTSLPAAYENRLYSVMSYTDWTRDLILTIEPTATGITTKYTQINARTPMILDIAAVQSRYGRDLTTNAGNTTYTFNQNTPTHEVIYDAAGVDTIDLSSFTRASIIDLTPGSMSSFGLNPIADQIAAATAIWAWAAQFIRDEFNEGTYYNGENNVGIAFSTTIENAIGGSGADTLIGNSSINFLTGNGGNDIFDGGGGGDVLSGGAGTDLARYSSASASYSWTALSDGSWMVRDLRAGAPDGEDLLMGIESVQFTDRTVSLVTVPIPAALATSFANILRLSAPTGAALSLENDLAAKLAAGTLTQAQANAQLVVQADASTSVATLAYQFFTGRIPSLGGIDFLVSPTGPNGNNLNSAYYTNFNLENRYINFAVNLGKFGDGKDAFQAAYGARTLFDATKSAYATIFGGTPTDAKVTALLSGGRDAYFAVYGGDGVTGIGTKAAMVGWLMAEAVKADVGMYSRANDAFLLDLADGATFAIDLVGVYGRPEFNYSGG